jgi:catechol-2,3-dioxygenase
MTANAPSFGLNQIGQISINVHEIERAVTFYRDVLGIQFLFKVPNMAFFSAGGIRLMLTVPEKPEFDHPMLYLEAQKGECQL